MKKTITFEGETIDINQIKQVPLACYLPKVDKYEVTVFMNSDDNAPPNFHCFVGDENLLKHLTLAILDKKAGLQ
jgi:hypothetical protein